jgi:histidine triad (HIT) family protein
VGPAIWGGRLRSVFAYYELSEKHSVIQQEFIDLSVGTGVLMETCAFCRIVNGVEPAHRVWETEDFLAFLTRSPCNPGHTLLIPKTHVDYVFDLEEPLYSAIFRAAKQLSAPIQRATDAERIGVAVEGFSVPHVHLHLVPLYNVSELDPHRHIEQSQQELTEMAGRIRSETPGIDPSAA